MFNADLEPKSLEALFVQFNSTGHPLHRGHSMLVSDVVVIEPQGIPCLVGEIKGSSPLGGSFIHRFTDLVEYKEGCEIIQDNCQDTIFGGFAPNSQTAETLSKALGNRTVLTGSVNKSKEPSQSLQMTERPLLSADELKSIPKGQFVVMKTGMHPMRTRLRLFLEWGISFEEPYVVPKREHATIRYAGREELVGSIQAKYPPRIKSGARKSDEAEPATDTSASHVKT